jgi:hypothetical protein
MEPVERCNKCAACMGFPGWGQCLWWELERLKILQVFNSNNRTSNSFT